MSSEEIGGQVRIGTLARRTGVSPELLRAWERRYGLLRPARTDGGYRLYDSTDEERIRRMKLHLARGLSAREAARLASAEWRLPDPADPPWDPPRTSARPPIEELAGALRAAMDRLDERAAQDVIDRLLATWHPETAMRDVLFPFLRELGERWAAGTASVADEHFASAIVRARLLGLARGWGRGSGPVAVLACLPGEGHDIGLVGFGLALRSHGWRIAYMGADTPLEVIGGAATKTGASLAVLSVTDPALLEDSDPAIGRLAGSLAVLVGGPGAGAIAPGEAGVHPLDGDVFVAADSVATWAHRGPRGVLRW